LLPNPSITSVPLHGGVEQITTELALLIQEAELVYTYLCNRNSKEAYSGNMEER